METPYSYSYAGMYSVELESLSCAHALALAGRTDRLQEVVTAVKTFSFSPGRGGLAGNDDSGGEAAWYVWSSIGIFPVTGQPIYMIGSPSFNAVTLHLGGSNTSLTITRSGTGAYIQSGLLNKVPLDGRAWMWVDEVHAGGDLELIVGTKPNLHWGSRLPPSFPSKHID